MPDFSDMSVAELEEAAQFYKNHNWEKNEQAAINELESRTSQINDEIGTPEPGEMQDQTETEEEEELSEEEQLREQLEVFEEHGWERNAERVREQLDNPDEMDSEDDEGDSVEELREKLEKFEEMNWQSNADRIRAELAEMGELDHSEELSHSEELRCNTATVHR
jgi:hypothetical protein